MREMGNNGKNSSKPVKPSLYIGTVNGVAIGNPIILAPMAGVTDAPYRRIAAEFGPGLMYGEMVSAKGLLQNNRKSRRMVSHHGKGVPYAQQLFGCEPDIMVRAAKRLEKMGVDLIDINMGCPAPKIVENGEGAALLRTPELAAEIARAIVDNVNVPVMAKLRKGFDRGEDCALRLAKALEAEGVSGIAIHGRTRAQYYSGTADWKIVTQLAQALTIPVIGNGDIVTPGDAKQAMVKSGCDAVMIGRAAMGNPWLLKRSKVYLEKEQTLPPPNALEIKTAITQHYEKALQFYGAHQGIKIMRKQLTWYLKNLPESTKIKDKVVRAEKPEEIWQMLEDYFRWIDGSVNYTN